MTDDDLLRYSRHILLADIGIEGQARLAMAHVLVVGAGGLGSPVCLYLAGAGIGTLTIADGDVVDLTNLQRQIAHAQDRIGMAKAVSATASVAALNPFVTVVPIAERLAGDALDARVARAGVVVDCSDNFVTRQAVNAACVRHRKPLVTGAAVGFDGQVTVVDPRCDDSPCYACIFPPSARFEDVACSTMGVFAPLVGIIGSLQAAETLKLLLEVGASLAGRLLMLDARAMAWTEMRARRDPTCPVCATSPTAQGDGRRGTSRDVSSIR